MVEGEALSDVGVELDEGADVELGKTDSGSAGAGLKLGPKKVLFPFVGSVVISTELGLMDGSLGAPATGLDEGLIVGFSLGELVR